MDIGLSRKGINEHAFFKEANNSRDTLLLRIIGDLDDIEQTWHGISDIIQLWE